MKQLANVRQSATRLFQACVGALVLACPATEAAEVWFESTLTYVYPDGDGSFVLVFNEDSPNCQHGAKFHRVRVNQNGVTEEGKRMMYAAALAAKVSGSRLQIVFDDASTSCYVSRLRLRD